MSSRVVLNYTSNNRPQVAALVAEWSFKPLARHDRWNAASLFDFTAQRVWQTLDNENGVAWVMLRDGQALGFASASRLPWDSEQLGVSAARLNYLVAKGSYSEQQQIKKTLLRHVLVAARERGLRHLSVRVDASDSASLHALEEAGFITVDGLLTFAIDLAAQQATERCDAFSIRLAAPVDAEAAAALARTAYVHDRFHCDPFIAKEKADDLHATWLRNSCTGAAVDAVLLAEDQTGLLGFVTCVVQRDTAAGLGRLVGTIVLVATAERARGLGVGLATTTAALEWFREQGCEIVEVGTQLRNISASRLYQKCGFRLVGSALSLRLLLPLSDPTGTWVQ